MDQIGPSSFKVHFPGLENVHPVFHASHLEPYIQNDTIPHPEQQTEHKLGSHGDDVYFVDKIVNHRKNKEDKWEYLVKWTGYDDSENTWEPTGHITERTLNEYWKKSKQLVRPRSKAKRQRKGKNGPN